MDFATLIGVIAGSILTSGAGVVGAIVNGNQSRRTAAEADERRAKREDKQRAELERREALRERLKTQHAVLDEYRRTVAKRAVSNDADVSLVKDDMATIERIVAATFRGDEGFAEQCAVTILMQSTIAHYAGHPLGAAYELLGKELVAENVGQMLNSIVDTEEELNIPKPRTVPKALMTAEQRNEQKAAAAMKALGKLVGATTKQDLDELSRMLTNEIQKALDLIKK